MFDLSNVKTQERSVLPPNTYTFAATNAVLKETKTGGKYIQVELTVQDEGTFKGRKVWTNFNVENNNPKAVEIGLGQLKTFLYNAGYKNPDKLESVADISGLIVGAKTKIKSDEAYGDKAEVAYFTKADQSSVLKQALPF